MRKTAMFRPNRPVEGRRLFFSVEQANRSLILVRRIVEDVINSHQRLIELQEILESSQRNDRGCQALRARKEMICVVEKIRSCLGEAQAVGIEVRDWSLGIVDYPARACGREIRLCWRYGEDRIEFWHEVGECFAGRKDIALLEDAQVAAAAR